MHLPRIALFSRIHYVEGKEGFLCMEAILTEAVAVLAAMVGDMDAEKNRVAVQHSFLSSFFSFFSLLSAVALYIERGIADE